jgi:predicted SnoaL-like aldol condensation-catalyzing enzyme
MTTRDDPSAALVRRLQECFNTRQFDRADDLHSPGFFSHPLGATGFAAGKSAWRQMIAQYPAMRVVAEDILVDGDKVAVRSSVEGIAIPEGGLRPVLMEIFRVDEGRLAEMWGASSGFPRSPEDLLGS